MRNDEDKDSKGTPGTFFYCRLVLDGGAVRERLEREQTDVNANALSKSTGSITSNFTASTKLTSSSSKLVSSGQAVMACLANESSRISPPKPGSRGKGVQLLSATEKDTYFGDDARNSFFGYYRQLSRQQHLFTTRSSETGDSEPTAGADDIAADGIRVLLDNRVDSTALGGGYGVGVNSRKHASSKKTLGSRKQSDIHSHLSDEYGEYLERSDISLTPSQKLTCLSVDTDDQSDDDVDSKDEGSDSFLCTPSDVTGRVESPKTLEARLDNMRRLSRRLGPKASLLAKSVLAASGTEACNDATDVTSSTPKKSSSEAEQAADIRFNRLLSDLELHGQQQLFEIPQHAKSKNYKDNALLAISSRPLSARSRFLISCVASNVQPDPSLVIRRHLTAELNISSKSIGDKMACVLAAALPTLPMLEILKLADNRLTDYGLTHILDVLGDCPRLTSLDISKNKVDSLAAKSLAGFLSHPKCVISELILRQADVDDLEAVNFITALSKNNTVTYLDLGYNLLGSHELSTDRYRNPDQFVTGAVALGRYLSAPHCSLKTLILTWNMIRLASCAAFVQSLAFNSSLTHLDMSYNGLGLDGGEILGDALHTQRSLQYLNISHNNIQPRAAFVILCGVRSCCERSSLHYLDISENPIGEVGGRAIMSLQLALGSGGESDSSAIKIDMKGCSLRIRDSSCWFDSKKPPKDLKLTLSNYYHRAVCIELLRLVAGNDDLKLIKCKLAMDKTSARELEFVTRKVLRSINTSSSGVPTGTSGAAKGSSDLEAARRLFRQYDEDGNGTLDRHEVSHLLKGLGLTDSKEAVDQMLAVYDIEGTGVVEEAEFIHFLTAMQESASRAAQQANERRYLILKEDANASINAISSPAATSGFRPSSKEVSGRRQSTYPGSGPPQQQQPLEQPYLPPNTGTMELTVKLENAASLFMQTATSGNVMSVIQASKALADSSAMIDCALQSMSLKFEEAIILYRIMIKDVGDRNKVLLQLLPRMATPADARRIVNNTSSHGDLEEKLAFRALAGKLYDVYMRIPCGYYTFNFADPTDILCLHRFIEIHKHDIHERHRLDYGDTSENGNWLCNFRNILLDGQSFVITDEWLDNLPTQGHLQFDFISLNQVQPPSHHAGTNQHHVVLSDVRFLNVLIGLGILQEEQRGHIQSRISMLDETARISARGIGVSTGNEMSLPEAEEVMLLYDELKRKLPDRAVVVEMIRDEREMERVAYFSKLQLLPHLQNQGLSGNANKDVNLNQHVLGRAASNALTEDKGDKVHPAAADGEQPKHHHPTHQQERHPHPHNVEGVSIDSYALHLRLMSSNPDVSYELMATHTLDAIVEVIAGRYLTCAQLVIIMESFPTPPSNSIHNKQSNSDPPTTAAASAERAGTLRRTLSKYHSVKARGVVGKSTKSTKDASNYNAGATDIIMIHSLFSSIRVELLIILFPQIIDLVNFYDLIFLKLSVPERAMVLVRLGLLNIWNPLKLDGAYSLDLSVYEQRQVLKLLVFMAIVEPGENWVDETFRESRIMAAASGVSDVGSATTGPTVSKSSAAAVIEGAHAGAVGAGGAHTGGKWELPYTWFVDTCIPHEGVVNLKYFSGNGTGANNCAPNPMARMLLMCLVHPLPYQHDAHKFQRASLSSVHELNVEFGSSILFGGEHHLPQHAEVLETAKLALK
jgi:hypothetical protein